MKSIGIIERMKMPDYRKTRWGEIKIDTVKCIGCALCVKACPADSIMISGSKAQMKPLDGLLLSKTGQSQCMGCGDCTALCPTGAISLVSSYSWTKYFKTIDRGELSFPRL